MGALLGRHDWTVANDSIADHEPQGPPPYWFRAKRYGYGWGLPSAWQGSVVFASYLVVVLGPLALRSGPGLVACIVALVLATPMLVWVGYRKGEPAHWRWGGG